MEGSFFSWLNDIDNYESRKIGRNDVCGLTVSTAYTSDMGYETAIIDENGVYPVERYSDKDDALNGHIKWCIEAKTITHVIKLGWFEDSEISQKLVTLKRMI